MPEEYDPENIEPDTPDESETFDDGAADTLDDALSEEVYTGEDMTTPEDDMSEEPATSQLLANTLEQVRTVLDADLARTLLPEGTTILGVRAELYQSPELAAARDVAPDRYPVDDRNLIILTLQRNQQAFLVGGTINPTDKFDMDHALGGGIDARETNCVAYAYDGEETITEYAPDGIITHYTGEYGDPEMLLSDIRSTLGELVGLETLGVDPSS